MSKSKVTDFALSTFDLDFALKIALKIGNVNGKSVDGDRLRVLASVLLVTQAVSGGGVLRGTALVHRPEEDRPPNAAGPPPNAAPAKKGHQLLPELPPEETVDGEVERRVRRDHEVAHVRVAHVVGAGLLLVVVDEVEEDLVDRRRCFKDDERDDDDDHDEGDVVLLGTRPPDEPLS